MKKERKKTNNNSDTSQNDVAHFRAPPCTNADRQCVVRTASCTRASVWWTRSRVVSRNTSLSCRSTTAKVRRLRHSIVFTRGPSDRSAALILYTAELILVTLAFCLTLITK